LRLALGGKLPGYVLGPPVCVLAERVEGYATPEQWQCAYGEIVELERTLAAEGMVLIKFFLHISEAEQLRRFERRRDDPLKTWKLTPGDWENRRKRPQYSEAIADMLARIDHGPSPWQLVEGESKKYARVKVVETVIERIERGMRDQQLEPPAFGT
jgi:polyphosphate kinase 2 (PPK2 family)